ncbi:MAG TPA: FAD-dependent thymidylate synthase [Fibrobacteria bacterium]|nr:FAD-dependent thymidylate synthase [Fibrobacteria bacterium]
MNYTTSQEVFLRHFFTNTDSDVYCATDAMPMALWAFLEGGYSRSQMSMRDRFLKVFEEISEKDEDAPTIEELADAVARSRLPQLDGAMRKASDFMSKWAVEYGHNSLKDSSVDRFALENVSQRAAKLLEHSQLGAFQEKSTRYLDFSADDLVFPPSLIASAYGEESRWQSRQMMVAYRELLDRMKVHFEAVLSRRDFKTEAAWMRTAHAKAFDVARYLLPCSVRTSLGATMPSRETERHIAALLASPHEEIRALAQRMRDEAQRINPGLLKHVQPNPYLERTQGPLAELAANLRWERPAEAKEPVVELSWISPDIELLALSSALCATERLGLPTAAIRERLRGIGPSNLADIARAALEGRGPHDEWPREFAVGQIGFDLVLDFGAWRDLQRHRVGLQLRARPATELGYSVPEELLLPSLTWELDHYRRTMDRATEFHARVARERPHDAEYLTALGHHTAWTAAMDLRQWAYLVELRSGPSGHQSYRDVAHRMARAVLPHVPNLAGFLRVDWSGEADRRQAEERIQAKLEAARKDS